MISAPTGSIDRSVLRTYSLMQQKRAVDFPIPGKKFWLREAAWNDPIYTRGYAIGVKRFSTTSPATAETNLPNEKAKKPLQGG